MQGVGRLLRVGDRSGEQVRDPLVPAHLDPLRVDQDEADYLRGGPHQDRGDHGVDARRLAGAGRPGDEQVGHGRQVEHYRPAADVAPHRHLKGMAGLPGLD